MRLALLLLAGIASCARPDTPPGAPTGALAAAPVAADSSAVPASGPEPVVVLERSGCEGVCPVYTVSAWTDGRVVFEGDAFVAATRADGQVPPDTVAALVRQAAALGHARLPEPIPCARVVDSPTAYLVLDLPSATTTVRSAAGLSSVSLYGGCGGHDDLEAFEVAIDRALGTEAWVGPREPWYDRQ